MFIYQNLRTMRKIMNNPRYCPILNYLDVEQEGGVADTDEYEIGDLVAWWDEPEYLASSAIEEADDHEADA